MMHTSGVQHAMPYESSNGQHDVSSISEVSAVCHPCFPLNQFWKRGPRPVPIHVNSRRVKSGQ